MLGEAGSCVLIGRGWLLCSDWMLGLSILPGLSPQPPLLVPSVLCPHLSVIELTVISQYYTIPLRADLTLTPLRAHPKPLKEKMATEVRGQATSWVLEVKGQRSEVRRSPGS